MQHCRQVLINAVTGKVGIRINLVIFTKIEPHQQNVLETWLVQMRVYPVELPLGITLRCSLYNLLHLA